MNTQQIIADLDLVRDILAADPSPARKSAAAVLLRAAADAIEAQSEPKSEPDLRPLKRGEVIQADDVYRGLDGKIYPAANETGNKYDPIFYRPFFRPINH